MTTRYQQSQIEDVAEIIHDSTHQTLEGYPFNWAERFADLFAADNPKCCIHCGYVKGTTEICDSADGQLRDEHAFEYGFDREQFLEACGLEGDG